jgi:hypothetical protein
MTLQDWINAATAILGQCVANIDATLSTLGILAISLMFVLVLIMFAYWKKALELYIISGGIALLFAYQWLRPGTDTFYIGIGCAFLGLTTILRGSLAQRNKSRG